MNFVKILPKDNKPTTLCTMSNNTVSSKKLAFSPSERKLIIALVRERPVIEDKRVNAKNIRLKKRAWEDLTIAYNSQPFVSKRLTHQLKRCWENMKTIRKKELSQESLTLKRIGGTADPLHLTKDENGCTSDNDISTIDSFINVQVPEVIDSNSIEAKADAEEPYFENHLDPDNEDPIVTCSQRFPSETDIKVRRTTLNIQQDQALHELRVEREKILIDKEKNLLEHEKQMHDLQIQKMKLEIELLSKQIENKTS
ncbi:myb/SANT-like DNA-binding domain-containing protein 3 [Ostrinia nubilalis]|uniref:myb/SANT-like DNA-binding domain-containing protein 3 n=1 Tax=Ostrinia nubilalis TaxID=29057 RepID=UPI0030824702